MTIHITPEPDFSYVSFETNAPINNYKEVISKVLEVFHPGKVTVTVFTNQVSAFKKVVSVAMLISQNSYFIRYLE